MKVTTTTVVDDGQEDAPAVKGAYSGDVAGVLLKADAERQFTLTVAYPSMKADTAVAADGHRDFTTAGANERAAHSFLTKSPKVGLWHEDGTEGAGQVVESYIWPGEDWTPEGSGYTVKAGDWLVGVVWEDEAWGLIKSGKVGGVSMQGSARRRKPAPDVLAGLRS